MNKTTWLILALSISFPVFSGDWLQTDILRKKNVLGDETRVTLKMPDVIPVGYWYTCNFYDKNSEIIASIHHVLRERVPSTNVLIEDPNDIYFALCTQK